MTANFLAAIAVPVMLALAVATSPAQSTAKPLDDPANVNIPSRAVRRDIPMTRMIQRAHAAGTRDSTGSPGRNYWQLWNEYKINASLSDSLSRPISMRSVSAMVRSVAIS